MSQKESPDDFDYENLDEFIDQAQTNAEKVSEEEWDENPEPEIGKPSPRTIGEMETAHGSAYIWNSENQDEWLQLNGDTMEIKR